MTTSIQARLALLAALGSTPGLAVAASDALPGDQWEVTSQMSMEGMPMVLPPNKVKVCSPKEWREPPGGADERRKCANSDFKIEGAKVTWKVSCAGPPAMTGDGEITRDGDDSWAGTIRFASEAGAMTVKLSGHKLGPCANPQ